MHAKRHEKLRIEAVADLKSKFRAACAVKASANVLDLHICEFAGEWRSLCPAALITRGLS